MGGMCTADFPICAGPKAGIPGQSSEGTQAGCPTSCSKRWRL